MASSEAQHLVALSLGKIAASRSTRSGINLHKSLLVSSILYKARTAILMDKYRASLVDYSDTGSESDSSQDSEDSDDISDQSLECNEASAPADGLTQANSGQAAYDNNDEQKVPQSCELDTCEDKENLKPCDITEGVPTRESPAVFGSSENTTNLPSSQKQTKDSENSNNSSISKCERCTKRRLTSVDCEDTNTENSVPVKRVKNDENTPVSNTTFSTTDNCRRGEEVEEPMEQTQITHLVDSFNSGFGGLLNTTSSCVSQQIQSCASDYSIGISPKNQVQGLSEAFSYCSSQIKESFDTLTSPIIALTV